MKKFQAVQPVMRMSSVFDAAQQHSEHLIAAWNGSVIPLALHERLRSLTSQLWNCRKGDAMPVLSSQRRFVFWNLQGLYALLGIALRAQSCSLLVLPFAPKLSKVVPLLTWNLQHYFVQ
jgi:hypothetical protein